MFMPLWRASSMIISIRALGKDLATPACFLPIVCPGHAGSTNSNLFVPSFSLSTAGGPPRFCFTTDMKAFRGGGTFRLISLSKELRMALISMSGLERTSSEVCWKTSATQILCSNGKSRRSERLAVVIFSPLR